MTSLAARSPLQALSAVKARCQTALFRLCYPHEFAEGVTVFGWPIVSFAPGSRVRVGRDAVLISDCRFSEPGVSHPVVLRTLSPGAVLVIGDNTGMSGCTICASESVTVGSRCLLGADVFIADTDFHPVAPDGRRWRRDGVATAPISIGDNVFLGARAMILKGVSIGDDAVVGAGSVVVDDVPAGAVVAGVPARVVARTPEAASL